MKLVRQIVNRARLGEAAPAIAFAGGVATYGTLARAVEASISAIELLEVSPGAMVMLDVVNPFHHTALMFALALLGLPSASVSSAFSVEKSGVLPAILLTDRDTAGFAGIRSVRIDDRWFASDPARPVDYARLIAMRGFASPDDIVRYVYSSGTTGYPKCVAISQAVLELRIFNWMITTPTQFPGGAGLNMLGFSTIIGIIAPLISLPFGQSLCFASSNLEALQMIRLFKVESLSLVVAQLQGFLAALGAEPPPPSLRIVVIGGSRLAPALLRAARARICSNIAFGYGSTEMGNVTGGSGDSLERAEGSAGYVQPWVEMQAINAGGVPVAPGAEGIIRVRTPEMASYAHDAGDPLEAIRDGWFYPGDIGRIHADGLVAIVGRTSEVINRGGVVVAPEIIEEVLRLDPAVKDAAVVGVPNAAGLEEIWAAVVSDAPIDAQAIAGRTQPKLNEKLPDRILQIDAVPRNENGKITRNALRDQLIARVRQ